MVVCELVVQPGDLDAHLRSQAGVEIGERLVEQEDVRLAHDRAADRDALALAARKLLAACAPSSSSICKYAGGLRHLARRSRPCRVPSIFSAKPMFSATVMCG